MKQLLQHLDSGDTTVAEVPVPAASAGTIVVETRVTLVSAGTERMLVEFGRSGLIEKARSQPDKVKQVLDKVRSDGVRPTLEAVRAKLDQPIPLGYCNAGVVVEAGSGAGVVATGDRVVTNGAHAEYVRVPHTLAARIPNGVSFEAAAFTPVAAIGLQGIRLAEPTLGETVVVFGLGLIGLLTVQLLRANGCRVLGIDREVSRLALAERFGAVTLNGMEGDVVQRVLALTDGVGADAVLLTLASKSDDPAHQAAAMSRKRGRLVLVGTTGLDLRRDDFYRKELSFAVSCSYGPGRYDPLYEEGGHDYPLAHVRWTEQRNFEAVLALMADGKLDVAPLISHRFPIERAPEAYDVISGTAPSLGVVLTYPDRGAVAPARESRTITRAVPARVASTAGGSHAIVAVIGSGTFAVRTLLPALRQQGARLHTIASSAGASGAIAGEKFGFERVTTDLDAIWESSDIDTVFVLTRHDSHASLALRALRAGKHVFVEKPLALREEELDEIAVAMDPAAHPASPILTVGFNRRFAPLTTALRRKLAGRAGPLAMVITVNAGAIPSDHWTRDAVQGGGRIVGESCHFLDLARCLAGSAITDITVNSARDHDGRIVNDVVHLSLAFADGSTAVVHYLANGSRAFPKERIECFWDGRTAAIANWRRLFGYEGAMPWNERARRMDKGHAAEISAWLEAVRSGATAPIPLEELLEVSRWAIRAEVMANGMDQ
ncbi:MAG TPA: bi-domain-containing oxidoreductase [Gemmatimonadaceae bacterium]|nr:bi-domain-containing oxidoreductase [Gemmatimonadaceae bacterium]